MRNRIIEPRKPKKDGQPSVVVIPTPLMKEENIPVQLHRYAEGLLRHDAVIQMGQMIGYLLENNLYSTLSLDDVVKFVRAGLDDNGLELALRYFDKRVMLTEEIKRRSGYTVASSEESGAKIGIQLVCGSSSSNLLRAMKGYSLSNYAMEAIGSYLQMKEVDHDRF